MNELKQKVLSTIIATSVSFLGFEALSFILGGTYQLSIYIRVAFYLYAFHVFWLLFLFDLHLKKRGLLANLRSTHQGWALFRQAFKERVSHLFKWHYLRHYLNFLILPAVIYWSVVVLLAINPFRSELKQVLILFTSLSLSVVYWYFKEVYSKDFELHHFGIRVLSLVKLYAAFLFYAAITGYTIYFGMGPWFLVAAVFAVTWLLIYQALFQHRLLSFALLVIAAIISLMVALVSYWVYVVWNQDYLTGALVILAVYNTSWGLLHHHLDGNLNKRLALEYLFMLVLVLSLVLASHDFSPRI